MRYLGNKSRLSKELKPLLERNVDNSSDYIEPFVGAAGMISAIDHPSKWGYDNDKYIIALLKAARNENLAGLPESLTVDEYNLIISCKDCYPEPLVGFVGYGCSFGGKWCAGLAKGGIAANGEPRNYVKESKDNLIRLAPKLANVSLCVSDYRSIQLVDKSIIYCDPPYESKTKFKGDFDHAEFWGWVRKTSVHHYVYTSEYSAPADFKCIWEKETKTGIHHGFLEHPKRVEKLFVYKGGLSDQGE